MNKVTPVAKQNPDMLVDLTMTPPPGEFGFDSIIMASSVFAFNIGIEVVQLLVILLTMP